jgi:hypothetical protein
MRSFTTAVKHGVVTPVKGELRPDLLVLVDKPNGETRFSYALLKENKVVAMATLGETEPYQGLPCFQLNYAVEPSYRGRGLALDVSMAAIAELRNGFGRNGVRKWFVEAIVDAENEASLKVAGDLFSDRPSHPKTDEFGNEVFQFIELVDAGE